MGKRGCFHQICHYEEHFIPDHLIWKILREFEMLQPLNKYLFLKLPFFFSQSARNLLSYHGLIIMNISDKLCP